MLKKFKQLLSLLFQLRKLDQNIEEINTKIVDNEVVFM